MKKSAGAFSSLLAFVAIALIAAANVASHLLIFLNDIKGL